jgi:hypothetical protein
VLEKRKRSILNKKETIMKTKTHVKAGGIGIPQ